MDQQTKKPEKANPLEGCPEPLRPALEAILSAFPDSGMSFAFFRGDACVFSPTEKTLELLRHLKEQQGFDYLVDVGGLHDPGAENEFVVFYNLTSLSTNRRIRIKTPAPGQPPTVASATSLWVAADWHEREAFDMFGIVFEGHPNLTRIYLPDHVTIHPLRKNYPLRGDNTKPTW